MRAAFVRDLGGTDRIEVGELPDPVPGPDDVVIAAAAAAVNHVDTYVRSGAYATPVPLPFVLGRDVVGTVVSAPPSSPLDEGTRVWSNSLGHAGRQGTFSDLVVAPANRVYRAPQGEPDDPALVSMLHPWGTAYLGLVREARLLSGARVFVGGAGGAVGSAAVQLAVRCGAHVVGSAGPGDEDFVRACGASAVVDHTAADFVEAVAAHRPGGFDLVWDTSGRLPLADASRLCRNGGAVLVSAGLGGDVAVPVGALYTRDITLHGFAISNASVGDLAAAARTLNAAVDGRARVLTRIAAVLPLSEARRSHDLLEHPPATMPRGRLVVTVQ